MERYTLYLRLMFMFNPPHPGEILKEDYLVPLGLTITKASMALDIARKNLSAIVNGRAGISPSMAIRLSMAFDTSPEFWLNLQSTYNLWVASQENKDLRIKRLYTQSA